MCFPTSSQEQCVGTPVGMDILPRLVGRDFPAPVNSQPLETCQNLAQKKAKQSGSGRETNSQDLGHLHNPASFLLFLQLWDALSHPTPPWQLFSCAFLPSLPGDIGALRRGSLGTWDAGLDRNNERKVPALVWCRHRRLHGCPLEQQLPLHFSKWDIWIKSSLE